MRKKGRAKRRSSNTQNSNKNDKQQLPYRSRTPEDRFEELLMKSIQTPVAIQLYIIPFVPAMFLFISWDAWGSARGSTLFWIGIACSIITFFLFIRMFEGFRKELLYPTKSTEKSVRNIWWKHFRVVLYVNGIAIILTSILN